MWNPPPHPSPPPPFSFFILFRTLFQWYRRSHHTWCVTVMYLYAKPSSCLTWHAQPGALRPVSHCCHFPGCLSVHLKAALSQRACVLPISPVESANHRTKLRQRAMRLLALVPIFWHVPLWHPHGHLIPPIMFLWFYSLLMRQERGVSGCVHWCDGRSVCWMRVNACADALSHLPITGTCRVITESWPWRSGPQQGALYSWSFKGSHPTLIRHAQLIPPSSLLYVYPKPWRTPWFQPPSGMGLRLHVARGDVATGVRGACWRWGSDSGPIW